MTPALVLMFGVLGGTVSGCGHGTQSPPKSGAPEAEAVDPGWRRIADSPLSPRQGEMVVWTGSEMLVFGGYDGPPCPPNADCLGGGRPLTDGAAYDPTTDAWRPMADLPVLPDDVHASWEVDQVVLRREGAPGERGGTVQAWAYDIDEDTWSRGRVTADAEPTPGQLDPRGRLAASLPPDPAWGPTFDRSVVWTGTEYFLTALLENDPESPKHYRLARFRPGDEGWTDLGRTPVEFWNPVWYWFDARLVNPSQNLAMGATEQRVSGAWNPTSNTWEPVAQLSAEDPGDARCPLPEIGAAGDWLVTHNGILVSVIPSRVLPAPACDDVVEIHSALWTGSEILTWGAVDHGWQRNLAVGYRWQPPSA
ncbi:MAG: hypothetical protein ACRDPJ_20720 [Nocardioidaceae bacterium]